MTAQLAMAPADTARADTAHVHHWGEGMFRSIPRDRAVDRTGWHCRVLLLLASAFAALPAVAADIPFRSGRVEYQLDNEPLPSFLERFFADQGLNVVMSDEVVAQTGTLNGPRAGSPAEVFRGIANSNQLIAYYDGATVYVYKSSDRVTRDFVLPPSSVDRFVRAFVDLRLGDENNMFTASPQTGIVMVTGAPRFIEQAEVLANSVGRASDQAPTAFRYFPLRYAWASDTAMTVGNRRIVVPGVATILRQLMDLQPVPNGPHGRAESLLRPSRPSLRGEGLGGIGEGDPLARDGYGPYGARLQPAGFVPDEYEGRVEGLGLPPPLAPPGDERDAMSDAIEPLPVPGGDGSSQVVADPYRNAVIVRDSPERLALYEALIGELDVEPRIVEIEATIIDVDKRKLRRLGVNWRWSNGDTEVVFGPDGTKDDFLAALLGGDNIDSLRALPGLSIGGIIGDSSRFIARINALADEGVTHVVSRPQVVTLNDVEAVIENSQTLYVPVGGAYEVDLFNVVAGTVLRVTPHVIEEPDSPDRIRMVVSVEDGGVQLQESRVQRIEFPVVTRAAVNTHALIDEGQALLIGGLVSDGVINDVRKVPGLGDVPLLGALFRDTERTRNRTERLFLITPRLMPVNRITSQEMPSSRDVDVDVEAEREKERARKG